MVVSISAILDYTNYRYRVHSLYMVVIVVSIYAILDYTNYGDRVPSLGLEGSFLIVDSTTFLQLFYILQQKMRQFSTSTKDLKILHLQH